MRRTITPLMTPDLTDDDSHSRRPAARDAIECDRFPTSPKVKRLRGILTKLGVGSAPAVPHLPAALSRRASEGMALAKKRRR
jgi:hypothetical protein